MLIWPAEIQLYDPENRLYKVENSKEGNRSIINAKFYIIHTLTPSRLLLTIYVAAMYQKD
jgi:hypothetical protein